jgi:lysophospholipase L1-like esterase
MLEASRRAADEASGHFTEDGVHLTPEGYAALGRIIAARLVRDLEAR